MSRLALNPLVALINSLVVDNDTGLISPADVRGLLVDIVDSTTPAYALMWGDHTAVPVVRSINSATWTTLGGNDLFTGVGLSDPTELTADPATGNMPVTFPDFVYSLAGEMVVAGPNGRELAFTVGHDGVPLGASAINTLGGTSQLRSVANALTFVGRTGWNLQLLAKFTDAGATANVDIYNISMMGSLKPTHEAN